MVAPTDEPRPARAVPFSRRRAFRLRDLDRFWRVLLAISALGLAVRVGYVALAKSGPCTIRLNGEVIGSYPSECAVGDQVFYNSAANRLADGDGYVEPFDTRHPPHPGTGPAADHPPLTITVLAPVSFAFEHVPPFSWFGDATHVREQRYTMAVLGAVLVALIGLLGRAAAGERVGLIGAGVAAVYPNLWVNDGLIMSETVTGVAVVVALLLTYRFIRGPSVRAAALLGAVCGLAALGRAELALFVPLLAAPAALLVRDRTIGRRLVLAGAAACAAGAVVGPWVVYNNLRFEDRTTISTNDGIALAGSNCDRVYYGGGLGLTSLDPPCIDRPHPPGDQSVVAGIYRRRALDYASDHMRRVPVVVAARIARTWGLYRPADMISYNIGEGRERWVSTLGIWTYYPLLVLAVAGSVSRARRRSIPLWPLLVPAAVVTIGVALTYGQTRFRAAAEPSIVLLAAIALAALLPHREESGSVHVDAGPRPPHG